MLNYEAIAARSLRNCHVKGVYSLVLDPTPGHMVRIYYAGSGHHLGSCHPDQLLP